MIDHPTPQVAQATSSGLPSRIAWFERLMYAAVVISVVRIAINHPQGVDAITLLAWYVLLIIQLALIWLAARRRKAWACWVLLAFFLTWISFGILSDAIGQQAMRWEMPKPIPIGLRFCEMTFNALGLMLIFSRRGRRWFNPNPGPKRDWNGV